MLHPWFCLGDKRVHPFNRPLELNKLHLTTLKGVERYPDADLFQYHLFITFKTQKIRHIGHRLLEVFYYKSNMVQFLKNNAHPRAKKHAIIILKQKINIRTGLLQQRLTLEFAHDIKV